VQSSLQKHRGKRKAGNTVTGAYPPQSTRSNSSALTRPEVPILTDLAKQNVVNQINP
jgi:hypothetical protein